MTEFTTNQKKVIAEAKNTNMLVSASAGTGKTTVLVERIFRLVQSRQISVSDIAVVTFTNLAAAEMKNKLVSKLSSKKEDSFLAGELQKVDNAAISTLDSLCANLVREFFYIVDVDPSFSILDDITNASLKSDCLTEVLKEFYNSDDEVFGKVYSIFSKKRKEDSLRVHLLALWDFACCQTDFWLWYENSRNNFQNIDSEDNKISQALICELNQKLQSHRQTWLELADEFSQLGLKEIVEVCNENAFVSNRVLPQKFSSAMKELNEIELLGLPKKGKKANDTPDVEPEVLEKLKKKFSTARTKFKKVVSGFAEFWEKGVSALEDELATILLLTDKIVEILKKFSQKFSEAKRQRGVLDFADIEKLAYEILKNPDAQNEIRQRFQLVFVDEYQDTNDLQEAILQKLSTGDNLFVVGDVKQSIYGFRGCDSQIFVKKREDFVSNPKGNSVFELNDNFRSDNEILNFVNIVFNRTMSENFGSVNYQRDARLFGKNNTVKNLPSVQIDIVGDFKKQQQLLPKIYDLTATPDERKDAASMEGKIVAKAIRKLVGSEMVLPSGETKIIEYCDIAILSRSLKDKAQTIFNTLVENNIPVAANFKSDSINSKEIRDVVNFLRVLSNPLIDIPLVGVCLSHFGKLTEQELAEVKIATDNLPKMFLHRLEQYVGENKNQLSDKISSLLNLIADMRFKSLSLCVDQLILELLRLTEFHLFVQGLPNGQTRIRRLWSFVDNLKGKPFAQSVDKFVSFVEESADKKTEEGLTSTNAVRLMTMHASKGLEFPVVFVVDTAHKFNEQGKDLMFDKDIGIALKNYDFSSMRVSKSLASQAVKFKNILQQKEEEARLLYVALTRAKNFLFVVTSKADFKMSLPFEAANCSQWILAAMHEFYGGCFDGFLRDGISIKVWTDEELSMDLEEHQTTTTDKESESIDKILERLNKGYKFFESSKLPSKVVSSALDKNYLDFSDQPEAVLLTEDTDGRDIGTAYHKILEKAPLTADLGCLKEIASNLLEAGVILPEVLDKLDLNLILKSLQNKEFQKLFCDGHAFCELPFVLLAEYDQLFEGANTNEKIMLQGVLDLLILKKDSAIVVDYKFVKDSRFLKKNYAKQLESYKKAVSDITGIKNVEAFVLSIKDSKLVKM